MPKDKDTEKDKELAEAIRRKTGSKPGGSTVTAVSQGVKPGEADKNDGKAAPWHQDILNIVIIEEPDEDLIRLVSATMVSGEAKTLQVIATELTAWDKDGAFVEDKKHSMLKGKIDSTMIYAQPHSVGLMWKFYTTVGRVTAVVSHYANLREAEWIDVMGTIKYHPQADAKAIRLSSISQNPEDKDYIIILVKINGTHNFAEDGGRLAAKKDKGYGKGSK